MVQNCTTLHKGIWSSNIYATNICFCALSGSVFMSSLLWVFFLKHIWKWTFMLVSSLFMLSLRLGCRKTFHLQRFPSGPTTGWWSGFDLLTSPSTLPTSEVVASMEAWWWGTLTSLQCARQDMTSDLSTPVFVCSGSGAPVQCGGHGSAAEHPP